MSWLHPDPEGRELVPDPLSKSTCPASDLERPAELKQVLSKGHVIDTTEGSRKSGAVLHQASMCLIRFSQLATPVAQRISLSMPLPRCKVRTMRKAGATGTNQAQSQCVQFLKLNSADALGRGFVWAARPK